MPRRGLLISGAGLLLGFAGSLVLTRALSSLLYQITPHDPVTLACVTVSLGIVAVLACYLPAWRDDRVDPVIALRYE